MSPAWSRTWSIGRAAWTASIEPFFYFTLAVFVLVYLFLRFFRKSRAGISLIGIRERAALLGGEVGIESEPGKGTRLTVTIPLPVRG